MPRYGVETRWVNLNDEEALRQAITPKTRVLYFESPINPTLTLIDIAAKRKLVDEINAGRPEEKQIKIVVDNTFATPYCQRPLELGAYVVLHSTTTYFGGHCDVLGGALVFAAGVLIGSG